MKMSEEKAKALTNLLSAQRAFMIALGKIFHDNVGPVPLFQQAFDAAWACNQRIAESLLLRPETIEEITQNVNDDLIANEQASKVGDLEKLLDLE
jgi:hypothetical protein